MSIIDTHMHIGKSFIYQKNPKRAGLSDQECLEQTLQAFSKYDVKKVITVYRDYSYFKDFQKQAKQSGVEVLGCQWISLAEDLPEVLDYEKDKTVLGVKAANSSSILFFWVSVSFISFSSTIVSTFNPNLYI